MAALVRTLRLVRDRQPSSPAVSWRAACWTYDDLTAAIAVIEHALKSAGYASGTRVALLLRNSPQYIAAYYGVLASGCVAVPLNVHERTPVLVRQLQDSKSSLLIADIGHPEWEKLRDAVTQLPLRVVGLRLQNDAAVAAFGTSLESAFDYARAPAGSGSDSPAGLASIIYTSGTTGHAKGVMLTHENLHSNARAVIASLGLTRGDHSLCVLPFHFSYGNSVLHSHLLCGARLTIEDNFAFPQVILQRLEAEGATGLAGVPSTFTLLLGRHRFEDFDLSRLRYVTQAGGPMPRPLLGKLRAQLPGVRIYLMYGQTEATARLTCLPPEDIDRKPGSVGLPIDGVEIDIRDGIVSAPRGTIGEIFVRGPNVMLGYWNDAEATAEVLCDGWLKTRDLGYLDADGYLYIVGRASDMIKVGAFRVSPQEIEEIIAAIDGVEEAAVVGVPDDLLGQAVKAVIVLRPGTVLTPMAIKAYCRDNLASYKIPKLIEFAQRLPRTSSGKIQRFKLAGAEVVYDS